MITRAKKKFALHTILVFRTTAVLIVLGTVAIFLLEWHRALSGHSVSQKLLLSFFQAVTPRTAGFNTMTVALFSPVILFMLIVFMFIGASPGGTGGGVKTTTFALLFHWVKELLLGRYGSDINTSRKRIPVEQAFRAFLITALAIGVLAVGFVLIMLLDNPKPLNVLFEIVSALGTVGLSMGSSVKECCSFSHDLSALGKLVVIVIMITGRVGTITIGSALLKPHLREYKYPQESIAVG